MPKAAVDLSVNVMELLKSAMESLEVDQEEPSSGTNTVRSPVVFADEIENRFPFVEYIEAANYLTFGFQVNEYLVASGSDEQCIDEEEPSRQTAAKEDTCEIDFGVSGLLHEKIEHSSSATIEMPATTETASRLPIIEVHIINEFAGRFRRPPEIEPLTILELHIGPTSRKSTSPVVVEMAGDFSATVNPRDKKFLKEKEEYSRIKAMKNNQKKTDIAVPFRMLLVQLMILRHNWTCNILQVPVTYSIALEGYIKKGHQDKMEMQLKEAWIVIEMTGDFSATVDPRDKKLLRKKKNTVE
ncbi:hypothetical protein C0J52_27963 [Blattella germanica]|nr:hypothetical protein C0J52_27963 [Blattella germanica]